MTNAWLPVIAFWIFASEVSLRSNFGCVAHKHNIFHMIFLKNQTWACDHLKTSNLLADNLKKNTWPRWGDTSARDAVKWYWSADTLFWQLSIDHMQHWCATCVHCQFSCASKLARKYEIEHWCACSADGRAVYDQVITKFSGMGRFPWLWGSACALFARVEPRY